MGTVGRLPDIRSCGFVHLARLAVYLGYAHMGTIGLAYLGQVVRGEEAPRPEVDGQVGPLA